jgi:DNA-binding transcriptional ArsR family regulator
MGPRIEYVEACDVRSSPFRVAITPIPSLSKVVFGAAGAADAGQPDDWSRAVRNHLRSSDYETLAPLTRPGPMLIPDALLGLASPPGESFADGIERMLATPIDPLANEICEYNAYFGDATWERAAREPDVWLRRYVLALLRAWKAFRPVWEQAQAVIERETERIAIASVRDAQLELLDGLLTKAAVVDERWCVECSFHEGRLRFPDDGFVLMPMLTADRQAILTRNEDILGSVCYSIGTTLSPTPGAAVQPELEGLLGLPRAQILRSAGRSMSIGDLAQAMRTVPSAATHHVRALEGAGLVERERRGRQVIVRRTARGDALLELYARSAAS